MLYWRQNYRRSPESIHFGTHPMLVHRFLIAVLVFCSLGLLAADIAQAQRQINIPKVEYSRFGKRIDSRKAQSLRQFIPTSSRQRVYRLDAGDVLGVFVKGVFGRYEDAPVQMPTAKDPNRLSGMGYPFVIRNDGTVSLPLVGPVNVRNMTVSQAEQAIADAYGPQENDLGDREGGLIRDRRQVLISLLRKRTVQVIVVNDAAGVDSLSRQSGVLSVELPADRANVLNAIAATGGPSPFLAKSVTHLSDRNAAAIGGRPAQLASGDVVRIEAAEPSVFYTRNGRFEIPAGEQLTVSQALAIAGVNSNSGGLAGALGSNGPAASNVTIARRSGGIESFNMRNAQQGNQLFVRDGDFLTVDPTPRDVIGNVGAGFLRSPALLRSIR